MPYLLDTNTLIQAKNEYYGFDICPGFWKWLEAEFRQGNLFSIVPVLNELMDGEDDLTRWAENAPDGFFCPVDSATAVNISAIATWVKEQDFKEAGRRDFLAKADPILIAYAMAHDYTVVTHEVLNLEQRNRVKIPVVCRQFSVPYMRTFDMLRQARAEFHYIEGL